mgnify:CR=1 FL=1
MVKEGKTKKYYWSKVSADWWDKDPIAMHIGHDFGDERVRIDGFMIKAVYMAMLTMSSATGGYLRVDDDIPYTPKLLANRLGTDTRIIQAAFRELQDLGAMVIKEDGTIYLPYEYKMVGTESDSAERVRRHRERQRELKLACNEAAEELPPPTEAVTVTKNALHCNEVTPRERFSALPQSESNIEYRDKSYDDEDNSSCARETFDPSHPGVEKCTEAFARYFGRQCNPA